jgi:hypothetical protein
MAVRLESSLLERPLREVPVPSLAFGWAVAWGLGIAFEVSR